MQRGTDETVEGEPDDDEPDQVIITRHVIGPGKKGMLEFLNLHTPQHDNG